jgi:hypothetical protein
MVVKVAPIIVSGSHVYCHLVADTDKELLWMAERLRVPIRVGKCPHLDLSEHKRELALRYGAIEEKEAE